MGEGMYHEHLETVMAHFTQTLSIQNKSFHWIKAILFKQNMVYGERGEIFFFNV